MKQFFYQFIKKMLKIVAKVYRFLLPHWESLLSSDEIEKLSVDERLKHLKLQAETQELRRPLFFRPAFWGTLSPLILALSGIFVVSWFGLLDFQKEERRAEKATLNREITALKEKIDALNKETEAMSSFGNLYSRGAGEFLDKKHEKAIDTFKNALKKEPSDKSAAYTYNFIGLANFALGNLHKSIENYTKAIALFPEYALAYFSRGNLNLYFKDYKKGFEDLNKATELYIIKPDYEKAKASIIATKQSFNDIERIDKKFDEKMKKPIEEKIKELEKKLEEAKKKGKE